MHSILVKDYMDHDPHAIHASATARDAVDALLKAGILGAPVIDDSETVIGYVSEQDCIKELLNDTFYREEPPAVTKLMSPEVLTVTADTSIVELAQMMLVAKPKNFPVVQNGKLVGLISRSHVLRALIEYDKK